MSRSKAAFCALSLAGATLWLGGCKDDGPAPLAAKFDYVMPARFEVPDLQAPEADHEVYVAGELHPDNWMVELNACPSTGKVVKYAWSIDGTPVGDSTRCDDFVYPFPAEGTYAVSLEVEADDGELASRTMDIVVNDLLIFGIGDSYASGEGNPDIELSLTALENGRLGQAALSDAEAAEAELASAAELGGVQWQNRRCHRSAHSGQVRAAEAIEKASPHTSVTFIHLACSGARVHKGILGGYLGVEEEEPPLPPQIDRVGDLAAGREIDALVMSIGGNDVNFAGIIEACIIGEPCHEDPPAVDAALQDAIDLVCHIAGSLEADCIDYFDSLISNSLELDAPYIFDVHSVAEDENGVDIRQDGNDDLPDNYRDLARAIAALPGMGPDMQQGRVYLTEVPDITRNLIGGVCGWDTMPPAGAAFYQIPLITQSEMTWASDYVTVKLRSTMRAAAEEHGWQFVEGISAAFRRHGYCSLDPWVVRLPNTFLIQGDYNGAVHPNREGHCVYAAAIADAIAP